MEPTTFPAGTVLFNQGDEADAAYLVQSGTVEIIIGEGAEAKTVAEINAGTLFGEMALISPAPRAATAQTKVETTCIVVPKSVFNSILRNTDAFTRALINSLIQHVRSSHLPADAAADPDVQFFMPQRDGSYKPES